MFRFVLLILLCGLFIMPLHAQDNLSPYEIALQRIAYVQANQATVLDLWNLDLAELPPEIGQLTNLQELRLSHNYLTSLPIEIGQLGNLRELRLSGNRLVRLPPEIGQLTNLHTLNLSGNLLTTLPSEIQQLSNLEVLYLGGNQFTTFPAEITHLFNLQVLLMYDNQLTNLPAEIGQLSNLQRLDLSNNQLTSLPAEIGQLSNLCAFSVIENNLRRLPSKLGNVTSLLYSCDVFPDRYYGLKIVGNPLISPPVEVRQQGDAAVLAYLRQEAWYHLQGLIVAGAGGIGLLALLMLGFRFKQHGIRKPKKKRDAAA